MLSAVSPSSRSTRKISSESLGTATIVLNGGLYLYLKIAYGFIKSVTQGAAYFLIVERWLIFGIFTYVRIDKCGSFCSGRYVGRYLSIYLDCLCLIEVCYKPPIADSFLAFWWCHLGGYVNYEEKKVVLLLSLHHPEEVCHQVPT